MIVLIFHPHFPQPMLLIMTIPLSAPQAHAFYLDRWGIEHPPLVAKQMLGAERQATLGCRGFVFATEARQRLPELALMAGSVLSYVAACEDPIPTGFWEGGPPRGHRDPKSTPGRLRRLLTQVALRGAKLHFPVDFPLPKRLREKHSCTDHLPKGVLAQSGPPRGHRRTKQAISQPAVNLPSPVCQPFLT